MILDSSAIVAILVDEPLAPLLEAAVRSSTHTGVGAPTLVETSMVLTARVPGADGVLDSFLRTAGVDVVAFGDEHWRVARSAFSRFGKGRHPAGLNLGDCHSYATARIAGRPLLCVGDDFPRTDLDLVPLG